MNQLRLAVRLLGKTPTVTIIAIASLGLGIGAMTAIFSLYDQVLRRPLPVQEPSQLVTLSSAGPKQGSTSSNQSGSQQAIFSYPMFRDLERGQSVLTGLAAHRSFDANLSFKGETLNGTGVFVSGSYFPVLGLQPTLGRLLGPGDDGESAVVVLSHSYWQTHFGESAGVLNQSMTVNGEALTIVGVAPEGFDGVTLGQLPAIYVPIALRDRMQPTSRASLNSPW